MLGTGYGRDELRTSYGRVTNGLRNGLQAGYEWVTKGLRAGYLVGLPGRVTSGLPGRVTWTGFGGFRPGYGLVTYGLRPGYGRVTCTGLWTVGHQPLRKLLHNAHGHACSGGGRDGMTGSHCVSRAGSHWVSRAGSLHSTPLHSTPLHSTPLHSTSPSHLPALHPVAYHYRVPPIPISTPNSYPPPPTPVPRCLAYLVLFRCPRFARVGGGHASVRDTSRLSRQVTGNGRGHAPRLGGGYRWGGVTSDCRTELS